jgi:hypothetical protein
MLPIACIKTPLAANDYQDESPFLSARVLYVTDVMQTGQQCANVPVPAIGDL